MKNSFIMSTVDDTISMLSFGLFSMQCILMPFLCCLPLLAKDLLTKSCSMTWRYINGSLSMSLYWRLYCV